MKADHWKLTKIEISGRQQPTHSGHRAPISDRPVSLRKAASRFYRINGHCRQFADIRVFVRWYTEFLHKQDCELQLPMAEGKLDRITAILRKITKPMLGFNPFIQRRNMDGIETAHMI